MNKLTNLTKLQDLGLEETESKIYLHLLENGARTHLEISREVNIDRSKVYRSIEKLIKMNLLEEVNTFLGKKIQAGSPQNIRFLVEKEEEAIGRKKEILGELVEQLSSLSSYVKREFEVKHYRGQEGLRQMLWNHLSAKSEILVFGFKNRNDIVGKTYAEKIRQEQIDRKIKLYELENFPDKEFWYTSVSGWGKFYQSRGVSQDILDVKQYVVIYNDTVSIINWADGEEVGLEIINSAYAEMQRQFFWNIWELAGSLKK